MRILAINHEYPPLGGGSGVATRHLAAALAALGHEVVVLTSAVDGQDLVAYEEAGVRVSRFPVGARAGQLAGARSWLSFLWRAPAQIRRLVGTFRPDIIHSHFLFPSGYVVARAGEGVPHVSSAVGAELHDPSRRFSADRSRLMRIAVRRVLRQAGAVTTSARDLTERLQTLFPNVQPTEIPWGVPPPPADSRQRPDLRLPPDAFVVASLCRLVRRKRLDVLLEAVSQLRDPRIYVVIMGFGPQEAYLRKLAAELDIAHQVRFTGQVSEADKSAYLRSADVFCLPSDHEGFGLVFVEAMSVGTPVIATDVGGQTDFLRDGEDSFLFPAGDPKALAELFRQLIRNPAILERMKDRVIERAGALSPLEAARSFTAVYERVLGTTRTTSQTRPE